MAYQQLEELTSRKREKVALFLTAENMAGLLAVGLPMYIVTSTTSLWLRILILLAAAGLGVALTSEINGLAFYERVLWWMRGRGRRLAGRVLRPAEFTAVPVAPSDRPLPLGGAILRVHERTSDSGPAPRLAGAVRTAAAPRYRSLHAPGRVERETDVPAQWGAHGSNGRVGAADAAAAVIAQSRPEDTERRPSLRSGAGVREEDLCTRSS